jgi:GNAT superfamily N-acetyltransferase
VQFAPPVTRLATPGDIPALASMLARAFYDDPVSIWSIPPQALRALALERFQAARLLHLIAHEQVWMTAERTCAALWAPPDNWKTTARQHVELARVLVHPRLVWRTPLIAGGLLGIERRHPTKPPHWYLAILGTDPSVQGRGLGSATLAPVLEQCDRDGVGAYLECSKERNIDFYARHGFRVTEELALPRGPRLWMMWRQPATR